MYPIIALWSHPRSMSTAIERVMRERGDLCCRHEPFLYDYYVARKVRAMPHFEPEPGHPVTYEAIRDSLLALGEAGPVFFKDMSYYVVPRILEDPDFSRRLTNCFLVRNPLASIASYHKLDPEVSSEEIGIAAQWRHFSALRDLLGEAPPVLLAEAVQADTRGTMRAFWERIGLPYREEAFSWSKTEMPKDWEQVGGWHGSVAASGGIRGSSGDEDAKAQEAFAARLVLAPHLAGYLSVHGAAYTALKRYALGAPPL